MKSNNKRNSGLLYQKVLKKAPLYEPMMIRERRYMPKRIYQPIEVPNFTSQPPLKPMDPRVETSWSPEEVVVDKNSRAGNDLIIQENPLQELPKFEMPEFKPLRGKAKRQFKRENIQRVADKYGITKGQARRGLRKMRRAGEDYIPEEYLSSLKMVKRNSAVPFKLPHQSNSALPNIELSQAVKDSLHNQANLYGKPFFSPKHGVNVDPEDGVLSNRPVLSEDKIYEGSGGYTLQELENLYPKSEGRQLTYTKIDKPYSNAAPKQVVNSSGGNGDSELIKVDGRVVLGSNNKPISQDEFDYYQRQNELYPEYVYNSSSIPGFRDEAELNEDYPNAVIPKSTSVRHAQELMKNPDIRFYNKAVDSLMKMPGYERLKPMPRNR